MTSRAALFALLAMWGVGAAVPLAALAEDAPASEASADGSPAKRSFTNRVWVREGSELPGVMRIFLSDGTLVQDSCWETHRLSPWKLTSPTSVSWDEDGMEIAADIVSVSGSSLVLSLKLGSETVEERYAVADVPYVCPDMPRE
jgi:hypothetical protein